MDGDGLYPGDGRVSSEMDALSRSDPEAGRRARERGEINEYLAEEERVWAELREAMTDDELREEASVRAEQARCREHARRGRKAYAGDLAAAIHAGRDVVLPASSSRRPHRFKAGLASPQES